MTNSNQQTSDPRSTRPGPAARRRRWRFRMAAVLVGCLLALLLAEVAARLFDLGPPVYHPRRFEPAGGVPFIQIPNGPIAYRPNAVFASIYDPAGDTRGYFGADGRVTYRINADGMRGPAIPVDKAPGEFRVVCLGDSLTFGEGVHERDVYPTVLQTLLADAMSGRRVTVLNAGVQAHGTIDELEFFGLRCNRYKPDVVTLGFFLNDVTAAAETIRQNDARTRAWSPSGLARFSKLYEVFARKRHADELQAAYFKTTRESFDSDRWLQCQAALREMRTVSEHFQFRFVVVVFPILWGLDDEYPFEDIHARIKTFCHEADIEHIDLLETYRGQNAESLWAHPTDPHPNETAHKMAAQRIARHLTQPK